MTALPQDVVADLRQTVAELEQKLQASSAACDEAIAQKAVIAVENARLFNETREALERQTATSDILKVIASSPSDVQPVFDVIVERAVRLCGASMGRVYRYDGSIIQMVAGHGLSLPGRDKVQRVFPRPATDDTIVGQVMLSRRPNILADIKDDETVPPLSRQMIEALGTRSQVTMPMLLTGKPIGAITLGWTDPRGYKDQQIALLQTFADQAVIAIENVRLFKDVQQRTRDLTESLQQQTATADVLKVISRSAFDLQTVLDTLTESAARLCNADKAAITRQDADGGYYHATRHNFSAEWTKVSDAVRLYRGRGSLVGRVLLAGKAVQIPDVLADPEYTYAEQQKVAGYRTLLGVPLLRSGQPIGVLFLGRKAVAPFTDKQIELVSTFADQAVIAIENVRLFDEVQAKTRDLSEALTYQTGSANILKVIASSPTDIGPALKAIVESACELCAAYDAVLVLKSGDTLALSAHQGPIPMNQDRWSNDRTSISGRAIADRQPVHLRDVLSDEGAEFPAGQAMSRRDGCRSILGVPMLREGESIGAIVLRRAEVHPFSEKQIALLQTFADQAVIAIGNVRLFDEVQAKTHDLTEALTYQTGSGNILRVIASSPTDVQPVLKAIVESACELCEADDALVTLKDGDDLVFRQQHGSIPVVWQRQPINRDTPSGRAVIEGESIHVHDLLGPEGEEFPGGREFARRSDVRTVLSVPLMRENESIGAIILRRTEVNPFTDKQIALLQNFADQAVIAIGNVRLFEQVQQRTRQLAASLDDLRAAQDRLVQTEKLASLGQLTAGIAHEIKNPLNFVNNFAALSAELTDELNDALRPAALADKLRGEVNELTRMLKDNLEKVVQHGRRADSIVKNMLLHSREGSGEHRPADINALVDESLNLAYHGARAEKPDFNVTLRRDFDPAAGLVELFPQEITRVILNLVSNGFYALNKRRKENGAGFDPVLSVATSNLGDRVEIRIRDNGTGIPAEVKDKMFNPFFTTKPAGEGTGLGLSMSHDILVKQHGGTIDVETAPGQFTEFRIVLPRARSSSNNATGQT
ncbi:GAF domain-containing protein [Bradyrhizobium sp.]|uniref:GAF domain-containing protein n=1 Tax=Bradyrhizobium sp. TaxID=376 RepID=UPI003C765FE3